MIPALLLLLLQDWPTYHGGYGLDGVADAAPADAPARFWRFKAGGRVDRTPIVAGGRVFFSTSKGSLHAIDLGGAEVWKTDLGKDAFTTPLLHADGFVIGGTQSGALIAFDAATGKEKWRRDVETPIQGTANRIDLADGRKGVVIVSQTDGALHAFELETGKEAWTTEPIERCDGSAGVGGGRIVMGSCASAFHVFSAAKGDGKQEVALGEDNQVAGGVAVSGAMAFAGTRSGKLCAVDVAEGRLVWTNGESTKEAFTTPAVNERLVVFGSEGGKIYALKRETGATVWSFDTGKKPASPAIAGGRVVVSSGGTLFLLDLESGRKVWSENVSDEITSPAVAGGLVIVGADDGTVTAYK